MSKKNSVYNKIKSKTLLISLVSVFCVGLTSILAMSYMRGFIIESSENLGLSTALDSKRALIKQTEETLLHLASAKAEMSDSKLSAVSDLVKAIAQTSTQIASNPEIYGVRGIDFPSAENDGIITAQLRLADETLENNLKQNIGLFANIQDLLVTLCSNHESVRSAYIGTEDGISISADGDSAQKTNVYDPRIRPWYAESEEKNELIWTDVFYDNSGRGLAITCASPFYNARGEINGVAGIGMTLEHLSDIVVETRIGDTGHAFIVNENGEIIISDKIVGDGSGNVVKESLSDSGLPENIIAQILNGESGIEHIALNGTERLLAYAPLKTLPWSLAVVINSDEVIASALESEKNIIAMKDNAMRKIDLTMTFMFAFLVALLIVVEFFTFVLTKNLAARLSSPIIKLSNDAEIIGGGNFDYKPEIKTGDEIETLADAFILMIENIKRITSERERIGAELDVAAKIQVSMLPRIFPPFPEKDDFEIFALMCPAKEVGGDFYDFFMVDEKTLAVVIADVSGKGVPAALFMVIAKTVIKNNAQLGKTPKDIFEKTNAVLCENNDENMFVTAFMGFLDLTTGAFSYANAGHNPPVIIRRDGKSEFLLAKAGFVLAVFEKTQFEQAETTLDRGDMLFLYTDGVTEAVNDKSEMLTEDGLLEILNRHQRLGAKKVIETVKNEIDVFAGTAEQADDITMLAVRLKHLEKHSVDDKIILDKLSKNAPILKYDSSLEIPAESENLDVAIDFIEKKLAETSYDDKTKTMIKISVEEIFINIARYAYNPGKGNVTIRVGGDDDVFIEFEDSGIPYNPLKMSAPDITLPAEKREIGGLGIYMVKNIVKKAEYDNTDGKNVLRLYY